MGCGGICEYVHVDYVWFCAYVWCGCVCVCSGVARILVWGGPMYPLLYIILSYDSVIPCVTIMYMSEANNLIKTHYHQYLLPILHLLPYNLKERNNVN